MVLGTSKRRAADDRRQGAGRPNARQEGGRRGGREALGKPGTTRSLHELDGTPKSLLALARTEADLIFNLTESFAGDDTADFKIAAFLDLLGKRTPAPVTHGLLLAQDKAIAKKIFAFHGIHTPVFAGPSGDASISPTTSTFRSS